MQEDERRQVRAGNLVQEGTFQQPALNPAMEDTGVFRRRPLYMFFHSRHDRPLTAQLVALDVGVGQHTRNALAGGRICKYCGRADKSSRQSDQ